MKNSTIDNQALYFLKFSVMISNGLPLLTALEKLEKETINQSLMLATRKIIQGFKKSRKATLAGLMAKSPDCFDRNVIRLIEAGEKTGSLDLIFRILPEYFQFHNLDSWKKK